MEKLNINIICGLSQHIIQIVLNGKLIKKQERNKKNELFYV